MPPPRGVSSGRPATNSMAVSLAEYGERLGTCVDVSSDVIVVAGRHDEHGPPAQRLDDSAAPAAISRSRRGLVLVDVERDHLVQEMPVASRSDRSRSSVVPAARWASTAGRSMPTWSYPASAAARNCSGSVGGPPQSDDRP